MPTASKKGDRANKLRRLAAQFAHQKNGQLKSGDTPSLANFLSLVG
jgi:hypothetical protein